MLPLTPKKVATIIPHFSLLCATENKRFLPLFFSLSLWILLFSFWILISSRCRSVRLTNRAYIYLSKTHVDFLKFITLTFLLARRYGCPLRYHISSFCQTMFYLWELHVVYVWLCILFTLTLFKINNWKTFAKDYIMSRNVTATSLLRSIFLFLLWRIACTIDLLKSFF